jgi:hypothetical protein
MMHPAPSNTTFIIQWGPHTLWGIILMMYYDIEGATIWSLSHFVVLLSHIFYHFAMG